MSVPQPPQKVHLISGNAFLPHGLPNSTAVQYCVAHVKSTKVSRKVDLMYLHSELL